MKNIFNKLFFAFAVLLATASCKKSELTSYEQEDMIYIYKEAFNAKRDSTVYTFAIRSGSLLIDTVKVPVRIMGNASNVDREVKLAVVTNATTAIEGTHYSLLTYTIPAGAFSANLPVLVKRTPDMKTQMFTLWLEVIESKDFKPGVPKSAVAGNFAGAGLQYMIKISDFLVKPSNWDSQLTSAFGTFSQVKYKFIIDVTGKTEFITGAAPLMSIGELQYYKAFVKNKYLDYAAVNGPLIDEFGAALTFP